jgi:MHS family citrate/tricarballylate:H+ symporter-like MFS transporter
MEQGVEQMGVKAASAMIVRVTCGNFMEMFDFFLFGFYATYISQVFFPSGSDFASLMLTFMTFGVGFLMRPIGALLLGAFIDRAGRRRGLIVTLAIMAVGTLMIAVVPGYQTIGIAAPILVVIGRLLQGFSAGAELGGVSVYLSEIAKPANKGFFVAWQSGSQQVAIMASAALGYVLSTILLPHEIASWGWRIPFLIGCGIVPFLFYIRASLQETAAFTQQPSKPSLTQTLATIGVNWSTLLVGMLLVITATIQFYTLTVYTPTFGKSVLKLSPTDSLVVTFCVALSNFIWLPIMGALSDRIGRRPLLLLFSALTLLTAYPALSWLVSHASFMNMLAVLLWLSFLYGGYNGAMVVTLTEIIPVSVRTTGFSLTYSLATALFGGFTPMVSTWLIEVTGNRAAPAFGMMFAGACGLIGTALIFRRSHTEQRSIAGHSAGEAAWSGLPPGRISSIDPV